MQARCHFTQSNPAALPAVMRAQLSDAELVDLTLRVCTINTWNRQAIRFRKLPT